MKRILSIQDVSCLGSSSNTVMLPVASCMGAECVILPTALLSAHTFFDGFVNQELTALLLPFAEHWKRLGVHFDAICTGYLSCAAQADAVLQIIDLLAEENTLIFVDPAMADHGRLYPGLSYALPHAMARLCQRADVIAPNLTEACLLTDTPYRMHPDLALLQRRLLDLGAGQVLLTGVEQGSTIGVVGSGKWGELSCFSPRLDNQRPGTGDLFSAVCATALTLGQHPQRAVKLAADFISAAIRATQEQPDARAYCVHFQSVLPMLCHPL